MSEGLNKSFQVDDEISSDASSVTGAINTEMTSLPTERPVAPSTVQLNEVDDHEELDGFPFTSVFKPPLGSGGRVIYFLPAQPVHCRIVSHERASNLLDPILYVVELEHAGHRWQIRRSHSDFRDLHDALYIYRALLRLPIPTTRFRQNREIARGETLETSSFPRRPDIMVSERLRDQRIAQLEQYLNGIVRFSVFRDHPETLKFLGVSRLSFVREIGAKGLEGLVWKRMGGYRQHNCCMRCLQRVGWVHRWVVLKPSYMAIVHHGSSELRDVFLFDTDFSVKCDEGSRDVAITNLSRVLILRIDSPEEAQHWVKAIREAADVERNFITPNRFASFAPIRENSHTAWFVDGFAYFTCVADALESAREEIFITDWWLSPEVHMKRPATEGNYWRLDKILHRKAEEGVKVYVLLYKEFSPAVHLNSRHSKSILTSGHHENIKVLRHPDHTLGPKGTFLWSHHEKLVCVDQLVAFTGGLDLCYGRWDNFKHRLTDLGPLIEAVKSNYGEQAAANESVDESGAPKLITNRNDQSLATEYDEAALVNGIALNNERLQHTHNNTIEEHEERRQLRLRTKLLALSAFKDIHSKVSRSSGSEEIDTASAPTSSTDTRDQAAPVTRQSSSVRARWQRLAGNARKQKTDDEPRQTRFTAERYRSVRDRWSHLKRNLQLRRRAEDPPEALTEDWQNNIDKLIIRHMASADAEHFGGDKGLSKLWLGKDYANYLVRAMSRLDEPFKDIVDRSACPRIPWHDVAGVVYGAAARDLARHFIQRWNFTKREKALKDKKYPVLLPKEQLKDYNESFHFHLHDDIRLFNCNVQVLRSVGPWSSGQATEMSIHDAYMFAIESAKHYIYIENQFFVSQMDGDTVKNDIAKALYRRITRAHYNNEKFKVYVVLPLLTLPMECVLWVYRSVCADRHSLLGRLSREIPDPGKYISFSHLRVWDKLRGQLVSEMIYVHSKLLIVDDQMVIYGSANINDRSLLGRRDSELAVFIQDTKLTETTMAGQRAVIGQFASSLRRRLFTEFLGVTEDDDISLSDPVCDEFFHGVWVKRGTENAEIYEELFNKIPTNRIHSPKDMDEYLTKKPLAETNPEESERKLKKVRGYLSRFALDFLKDMDSWTPQPGTKGSVVPDIIWT